MCKATWAPLAFAYGRWDGGETFAGAGLFGDVYQIRITCAMFSPILGWMGVAHSVQQMRPVHFLHNLFYGVVTCFKSPSFVRWC